MAFVDRVVEYPSRFTLTDTSNNVTGPYTLTRDEGAVSEEGTLLNASNLNTEVPLFYFDTSAQTGTTDGDLYAAIQAESWESDTVDGTELITKELFTKILKRINFSIQTVTSSSTTTTSGSTKALTLTAPTNALCVCGYYINGGASMSVYNFRLINGEVQFYVKNTGSSSQTWTVSVQCLCVGD